MCGIAGVWRKDRPVRAEELQAMLGALVHRGPDDEGRFIEKNLGIGMRRLSIMDVAHGKQPYFSEDGQIVAVFNGEIYNYPELQDLVTSSGHRLTSHADGEVLVHLYEEYGVDFVHRISGMFAIALWDRKSQQLILARDRIGQKPLYVWETPDRWAFASEIKAFLSLPEFEPVVDPYLLPAYLAHRFVPAPHTLLKNVTKLRPGEIVVMHRDGRRQRRLYWEPRLVEPVRSQDMTYWVDRLDGLLMDVVTSHLASDVPLGIFLSGGLDSSVLAAMAAQKMDNPIEAWSASFRDNYPGYDEFAWAEKVAGSVGVPLHRVEVDMTISPDRVRELAYVLDEPMADPTVLPLDGVARAAAAKETVMISGEGADEIFAGYAGYGEAQSLKRVRQIPSWIRQLWARQGWPGSGAMTRAGIPVADRYRGVGYTFSPAEQAALLEPEWTRSDRPGAVAEYWKQSDHLPDLQVMQGFDVKWFLPDDVLLKADRIGMHYNLEIRVPYCDHDVVDLALAIPLALRRGRGTDKRVLREVARRHLPTTVVNRPKKGFPTPLTSLLGGKLSEIAWDTLVGEQAMNRGWFKKEYVEDLLSQIGPDHPNAARQVYSLLMLELWVEELVEAAPSQVRQRQGRYYGSPTSPI